MKILCIDTTRKNALVMIVDSASTEKSIILETGENIKHSEGLFLFIEKAMLEAGLNLSEVDSFACVVGPGSFTGIRVGMSIIKAMNKAMNKSIVAINMFEILQNSVKTGMIILNSTSTSCYFAKIENFNIVDTGVMDKVQIEQVADGKEVLILREEQDVIGIEYNNCKIIENISELTVNCLVSKLNSGEYGEFLPYYLQLSQAERNVK